MRNGTDDMRNGTDDMRNGTDDTRNTPHSKSKLTFFNKTNKNRYANKHTKKRSIAKRLHSHLVIADVKQIIANNKLTFINI